MAMVGYRQQCFTRVGLEISTVGQASHRGFTGLINLFDNEGPPFGVIEFYRGVVQLPDFDHSNL